MTETNALAPYLPRLKRPDIPEKKRPDEAQGNTSLLDFPKLFGAGAVSGAGAGLEGIAQAAGDPTEQGSVSDYLSRSAKAVSGFGQSIQETVSPETRQAMQDSTPTGSLFDGTASVKDLSLTGVAGLASNVLGQVAPQIGAAALTRGASLPGQLAATSAVAAAQGGGAASQEEGDRIRSLPREQLLEMPAFLSRINDGETEAQAREGVAGDAAEGAFGRAAPVASLSGLILGGGLSNAGQRALGKVVGNSRLARGAGTAAIEAPLEGAQEVAEGLAARSGAAAATGEDRDIGEGTAAEFFLGTLGGTGAGLTAGLLSPPGSLSRAAADLPDVEAIPEAQPAEPLDSARTAPPEEPAIDEPPVEPVVEARKAEPDVAELSPADLTPEEAAKLPATLQPDDQTRTDGTLFPSQAVAKRAALARAKKGIPPYVPVKIGDDGFALRSEEKVKELEQQVADATARAEQAEIAANTDELTGLGNRRAWERHVAEAKPKQYGRIDIDGLKTANDTVGHDLGDEMIKAVGEVAEKHGVKLFRVGGDEFTFADAEPKQVEALRKELAKRKLVANRPDGTTAEYEGVQFSYGLGSTDEEADSAAIADKNARREAGIIPDRRQEEAQPADEVGAVDSEPATGDQVQTELAPAPDIEPDKNEDKNPAETAPVSDETPAIQGPQAEPDATKTETSLEARAEEIRAEVSKLTIPQLRDKYAVAKSLRKKKDIVDSVVSGLVANESISKKPAFSKAVKDAQQELRSEFEGVKFDLSSGPNGAIVLDRIEVPQGERGQGLGAKAMQRLVKMADERGVQLALSPSVDFGATSKRRLEGFYKRFGFVPNKGKNRNDEISESMVREPRQSFSKTGEAKGPSYADTQKATNDLTKNWSDTAPSVTVVATGQQLPKAIRNAPGFDDSVSGVWHKGKVYIVADQMRDKADIRRTLAHEVVGHASMEDMLGKRFDGLIGDINKALGSDKVLDAASAEVAKRYGKIDPKQYAREIIAVMAENDPKHGLVRRVVAAVREFLRKLGLGVKYSGNDVIAMLGQAKARLETKADPKPQTEAAPSFSKNPEQVFTNIGDGIKNQGKGAYAQIKEIIADKLEDFKPAMLGAVTLDQLADLAQDTLPQVKAYTRDLKQQQTDFNILADEGNTQVSKWWHWHLRLKNRKASKKLNEIMHEATVAGADPALAKPPVVDEKALNAEIAAIRRKIRDNPGDKGHEAMVNKIKDIRKQIREGKTRAALHSRLRNRYLALPKEARELYVEARDMYANRRELTMKALEERIERLEMSASEKRQAIAKLQEAFETQTTAGPYFPLARHGDFWISAVSPEGKHYFSMQETKRAQRKEIDKLKRAGYSIDKSGRNNDFTIPEAAGASAAFVSDVAEIIKKAAGEDSAKPVIDEINQMYLRSLPDLSMRKHAIHRKKVAGFSTDALRAFASQMYHGAHQIAKLRHSDTLVNHILDADLATKAAASSEDGNNIHSAYLGELQKRHEHVMNPNHSKTVNRLSSLGFTWYLGLTPGAAFVNLTQTPIIAYPVLAAKRGWGRSAKELSKAMAQAGGTYGHINKVLKGAELQAYKDLEARGAFDKTQAHNLAGIADDDAAETDFLARETMQVVSHMFHKAEVINREGTGIAAYRLAVADGMSHDKAVEYAADVIDESHFNYTSPNRARYMQGNTAKVLLQFRQYSQSVTYYLARNFHQAMKGATPERRKEARRKLTGTLGMTALFSGTLGMPMASVVFGTLNALQAAFGDDEEHWDAETEFRNFLTDMLGKEAAEAIARGPIQSTTGLGIASRVSLDQLWFREPNRELEGKYAADYWLEQAAGPLGGIFVNAFRAQQLVEDGQVMRGIETTVPKALRDAMKAMRYSQEGVNNLRGDALIEEPTMGEITQQFLGMTPARLSERYEANNAIKNAERFVLDRRRSLLDAFALSLRHDDLELRKATLEKIRAYNKANPEYPIKAETIKRSIKGRARVTRESMSGVTVNKNLRQKVVKEGRFAA